MIRIFSALLVSTLLAVGQDQDVEDSAGPEQSPVRDLGSGKFKVGLVNFNQKTRNISFPCEVNMRDGPLEYVIVHENGKIHESILITKARPFHVNIALKLLGYKESKELFPILDDDFRPTGKYPKVADEIKNAARAKILLEWTKAEGEKANATLNDWVTYTVTGQALPPLPWVYGGSYVHNGSFQAEASGDIVALFTNNGSLFNWPGKDGNLDDVWLPQTERIPEVGTAVTVTIEPFLKKPGAGAPNPTLPKPLVPAGGEGIPTVPDGTKPLPLPEPKEKSESKNKI